MSQIFTPLEYQTPMTHFVMEHERCGLFVFMGGGKTVATLNALDLLTFGGDALPALVLAPKRPATSTWPQEQAKWTHLSGMTIEAIAGNEDARLRVMRRVQRGKVDVATMNYENLPWLVGLFGRQWPFKTVVADESTRLKSFRLRGGGLRAKALAQIAHTQVSRFVNLTGTPAPNGLIDLWGQTWFLDKGSRLGRTFGAFQERWFQQDYGSGRWTPRPGADEQIHAAIEDIYLTIDAKDYFDIEDPIVREVVVELPPRARQLYTDMEKKLFIEIQEANAEVEAFNAASRTIKLLQLGNGAIYTDDGGKFHATHDEKIEALREIVDEWNGAPILVVYQFKSDLARLRKAFPQGIELRDAKDTEARWNEGRIPMLFLHAASGGHGLNLQYGGNVLVFFSHWWNGEERQQVMERIGPVRQKQAGFDRPVFIYNIIAEDTLDRTVLESHESKVSVQQALIQAMKRRR